MQLSAVTKHLCQLVSFILVSFIPKLQHQHSKLQSPPEVRVRARGTRVAQIGGIFNSKTDLFIVFRVASSSYINETTMQQPLVSPN